MKLSEFANIKMGQSPKGDTYNSNKDGIPFLQGRKTFGRLYPTIDTWTTNPIKIANENDILMSVRAPVGDMNIANQKICIGRGLCSISAKNGRNKYLYYVLLNGMEKIKQRSSGTVFESISKSDLENLEIAVHSEEEQIIIEKILDTVDQKIELNNNMNQDLYNLSLAIYKEMFERESNENFETKKLSEVTINNRNKINSSIDYKVLSAVNTGNLILSDDYFDKQVYSKDLSKYLVVNKMDFAYNPARINIGSIGLNEFDFPCCVSPVYVTFSVDSRYVDFFDFYFKSERFNSQVNLRASGSVRQSLNYNDFGLIEVLYPDEKQIGIFNNYYGKLKNRIIKNKEKIDNLTELKNTLLPKLMNDEIDLYNIEI